LANAGGIIDLHYQPLDWLRDAVEHHVDSLAETFKEAIERSQRERIGTGQVADTCGDRRSVRFSDI
jgi:leucine dehydrogenase